jgi:predicted aspartyl protease
MSDDVPLVPAQVNGVPLRLVLDTGATRTMLSEETARRLDVALSEWTATTLRGVGGYARHRDAVLRSLSIGGVALHRRTLGADGDVAIGHIAEPAPGGAPFGGLLGGDYLSGFDLDLDLGAGTMGLYSVRGCEGRFLPWAGPYAGLPTLRPNRDLLLVGVELNGQPLWAEIDTGSSVSFVTAQGASRLGLTPSTEAAQITTRGVGPASVALWRQRFVELRIGPERQRDVDLWTGPVQALHSVGMILGADWLRNHRLWLSYATTQVFMAWPKP